MAQPPTYNGQPVVFVSPLEYVPLGNAMRSPELGVQWNPDEAQAHLEQKAQRQRYASGEEEYPVSTAIRWLYNKWAKRKGYAPIPDFVPKSKK